MPHDEEEALLQPLQGPSKYCGSCFDSFWEPNCVAGCLCFRPNPHIFPTPFLRRGKLSICLKFKVIQMELRSPKNATGRISSRVSRVSFPTCQVRVVRCCYILCQLPSSSSSAPCSSASSSSSSQCSPPDLNRQLQMAVFPAGPQPPAPDGNVPRRTSTASQKICQIERQKELC